MQKTKIIAGIEIGTGKVSVLLGEIVEGRSLNVIGMGQCSSKGVVKGDIVDFHEANDCTHAAILAAENQAGVKIDGVYLAMSGTHIEGFASEASVNVTGVDGMVTSGDLQQVCDVAQSRELPDHRTVIHHLRRPYRLDGRCLNTPVGMEGEKLEVSYWTSHGDARKISDAIHIINGFNLHVDDIILSGLASSSTVTTPEERKSGVLVIDLGRGTTDYALYSEGRCMIAGSVPIGGDHVSNDLSIGLRVRLKQAESLKLRFGSAVTESNDKTEKVWLNNDLEIGDRPVPLWSIQKIVELRMAETLEVVKKKLGKLYSKEKLGAGVVLCGGGSNLKNIDQCASAIFGTETRIGDNRSMASGELKDGQYSTPLGLLHYGLRYQGGREIVNNPQSAGLFGKLKGLFQKG